MQNHDGDLSEFFAHEIQSFQPYLLDLGKLQLPNTKSNVFELPDTFDPPSACDCLVLDGAVIVHLLPTARVSTFNEYYSLLEQTAGKGQQNRSGVGYVHF